MLSLSGSAAFIMTSTSGWGSPSSTALVWTRGGEMAGKMVPVTKPGADRTTCFVNMNEEGKYTCVSILFLRLNLRLEPI